MSRIHKFSLINSFKQKFDDSKKMDCYTDFMKSSFKINWAIGLLLIALFIGLSAKAAERIITDDDISDSLQKSTAFNKAHSLMAAQGERLTAILNGFLTGNTKIIDSNSDELLKSMHEVIQAYPPTRETSTSAWQTMMRIVEETHLMDEQISKSDYEKAFVHFNKISSSCIECHQLTRERGKLPKPAPPEEVKTEAATKTEANPETKTVSADDKKVETPAGSSKKSQKKPAQSTPLVSW